MIDTDSSSTFRSTVSSWWQATAGRGLRPWSAVAIALVVFGTVTPTAAAPVASAAESPGNRGRNDSNEEVTTELLVADFNAVGSVRRFTLDGAAAETLAGAEDLVGSVRAIEVDPDGLVYAAGAETGRVVRYDPAGGSPADVVIDADAGLDNPRALAFDDDGVLLVASSGTDEIVSFDVNSGEPLGVVASDGLDNPGDMVFDDGRLWVTSQNTDSIIAYDDAGDVVAEIKTDPGSGPVDVTVGPDGALYVAMADGGRIDRVTLPSERPGRRDRDPVIEVVVGTGLVTPTAVSIGPDDALWVADHWSGTVRRFDPATGEDLGLVLKSSDDPAGLTEAVDRFVDASFGPADLAFLSTPTPVVDSTDAPGRGRGRDPWLSELAGRPHDKALKFESGSRRSDTSMQFAARAQGYVAGLEDGDALLVADGQESEVRMGFRGRAAARPGRGLGRGNGPSGNGALTAVEYTDVYPGIDVVYSADGSELEYSVEVEPGADPREVVLDFSGTAGLDLGDDGALLIETLDGPNYVATAPYTYQQIGDRKVEVDSSYEIGADGAVGFKVGDYDPALPLIIDPTFRATATTSGSGTAVTVPLPAETATDDVLVAQIAVDQNSPTVTPPAGWTFIRSDTGSGAYQGLWYRVATSSEPAGYTWTLGAGATYRGAMGAFSDVDTTDPIDVHGGGYDPSGGPIQAPSITTTVAETQLVGFWLVGSDDNLVPPTPMIERWDLQGALSINAATQSFVGPGATGTRTATISGSANQSIGQLIALKSTVPSDASGRWHLDEGSGTTAIDSSGNGNNGTLANGASYTAGVSSTGVSFAGDGDERIQVPDAGDGSLDPGSGDFAVETWFRVPASPANGVSTPLVSKMDFQNDPSIDGYELAIFGDGVGARLFFKLWDDAPSDQSSGVFTAYDGANDWADGRWHHAVGQRNGSAIELWVDGELVASDTHSVTTIDAGNTLRFGVNQYGVNGFTGTLDEISIYSNALAAGEIVRAASAHSTVNSTADGTDATPGDNLCATGSTNSEGDPECTLRAAIQEANASPSFNTIRFGIPTTESGYEASPAAFRIQPGSVLPNITDPVVIDAATQPEHGVLGRPVVVLDGTSVPQSGDPNGLSLNAGNSTIRGLVIQNFGEDGIEIDVNGNNTIVGNYIGTDVTGTLARPNGVMDLFPVAGISIKTDGNVIGGTSVADRNVISASTQFGIALRSTANGNSIVGNYIGTDAGGTADLGNTRSGVAVGGNSTNNTIGGSTPAAGNVISGNDDHGVEIFDEGTDGTVLRNNLIGVDVAGTGVVANGIDGISISTGADNTQVLDNLIAHPNGDGVEVAGASTGTVIQANTIGTDSAGSADFLGRFAGVTLSGGADRTLIGGTGAGEGNTIANAGSNAGNPNTITIETDAGQNNTVLGNELRDSEGIAIDLGVSGATANDAGDADTGPNGLLNTPVITSAVESGGTILVTYDLDVPANPDDYRVEFFTNPSGANAAGNHEAESPAAAATTGPGTGLTHSFAGSAGDVLTATATRIDTGFSTGFGATSEVSTDETVTADAAPVVLDSTQKGTTTIPNGSTSRTVTIAPVVTDASVLTFTLRLSDNSPDDVNVTGELVNPTTVVFERVGPNGPITIDWSVLEFASGVSVQRGTATHSGTQTVVPISTVDTATTFPLTSQRSSGSTFGATDLVRATLSSSELTLNTEGAAGGNIVKWQVITYNDATVQSGTVGLASGTSSGSTGPASAVDPSRTWLIYTTSSEAGTTSNIGQKLLRGRLSGPSTITFDRSSTGQLIRASWFLVEFSDGTQVQRGSASFGTTTTSVDTAITEVDPARSIAVGGAGLYGGRSAYTADDNPGVGWFTSTLTSGTNIRVQRNVTGSATADLGWTVIEWPTAGCPDTDGDGLVDCEEDANTDADNDPSTSPGPDTDGDTTPNYLDDDDDGDGTPTASENADPNADGDPRDAIDSDRDGQPDYLDAPTGAANGSVADEQKISDTQGGLATPLDNGDAFGRDAAPVGDIDGDGIVDLVVGAPFDDDGGPERGAVHVLFMNADGTVKDEQKISSTTGGLSAALDDSGYFGEGVAGLGDVDGDGIGDVAVAALLADSAVDANTGVVHVLFLNPDGTVKADTSINDESLTADLDTGDGFGESLAGPGDINGDGIGDLVVGAISDDDGGTGRGAVHVLFLDATGGVLGEQKLSDTAGGFGGVLDDDDGFGSGLAAVGDVDGDGVVDIAVGARGDDDGAADRGAVYVLFLNSDGTVRSEQKLSSTTGGLTGPLGDVTWFGRSAGGAGDVDADGTPDLLVGADLTDDGGTDRGAAFVLFLNADGTIGGQQRISSGSGGLTGPLDDGDEFGGSVHGIGDLDEDGTINVVVAARSDDDGGTNRGAVYVLDLASGTPPGPTSTVVLDNVQSDTTVLTNGSSSSTATIDAVDPSKAFLTYSIRGNDSDPQDLWVTGVLTNSTTVTFARESTQGDVTIEWAVTEFASGVSVQRGVANLTAATTNVAISSVDLATSFPIINHRAAGTVFGNNDYVRAALTSSTNLQLAVTSSFSNVVPWQVVTYDDSAVQTGTVSFGTGDVIRTAAPSAVDPAKAWLLYSFTSDDGTANSGQKLVRGQVTDATTLTFDRSSSGQAMTVRWYLVEFTDDAEVQHGSQNFPTSTTTADVAISPVDTDRSIALGGHFGWGGRSASTTDDNPGPGWFTTRLTSTSNLRIQRATAPASADLGWFVIHWPCTDSDSDGLTDCEEDANTDTDNDPTTNPGPDTDGDTTPNYLDADDDGDGTPTSAENADPNADGDPRDAIDSDHDGQPDYLDLPTAAASGTVATSQKISDTAGGLAANLTDIDRFGVGVETIGDLDGDGIPEVAVGALNDDDGGADHGAVYVLFLNTDGTVRAEQKISDTAGGFTATLDNTDWFGTSVASLGDLDGDGVPDIAVGADGDDDGGPARGAVHILFMNADGTVKAEQKISDTAGSLAATLGDFDYFGSGVSGLGDLDGDGIPDLVAGANGDDDGGVDRGAVHVLFLNDDGTVKAEQKISDTAGSLVATLDDGDVFGSNVSALGDIDDDGVTDLLIGAREDDDGGTDRGAAYVLFLNTNGTVKAEQKISDTAGGFAEAVDDGDQFGEGTSGVGDIDGDGVPDVIVGAFHDDDGGTDRGAIYVLFLNATGTVREASKISDTAGGLPSALGDGDSFGADVAGLGDLDGDGTTGLLIGAFNDDDGGVDRGAVYVLDLDSGPGVVAAVDDAASAYRAATTVVDVSANDVDPQDEAVLVVDVTDPANGTASTNGNGTVTYTSAPAHTGADAFDYWAIDAGTPLTGYWGLAGDATDAVGAADGTVVGASTVAGDFGQALSFDEVDDRVVMPDIAYNNEFTLSFDFKLDDNSGSLFQYVYSHGTVSAANSINIYVNESGQADGNKLRTTALDGNDTSDPSVLDIDIAAIVNDGLWHTYTLTGGSGGLRVYLDGTPVAADPTRGTDGINPTGSLYLGARNDLNVDRHYGGSLDTIQIHGRALTGAEVGDLADQVNVATVSMTVEASPALTVNATGDGSDANPGDGLCDTGGTNSQGADECTLRAAIEEANGSGGGAVDFAIPISDPGYSASPLSYTLAPASPYPLITSPIVLDATTQTGYSGDPIIELDGSAAAGATGGLVIQSNNSTIRGFIVHSFVDEGLEIDGSVGFGDNNMLQNNWVGLDAAGTVQGNSDNGILVSVDALDNLVGGTGPNDGNVVAGSPTIGVLVRTNSTGNAVLGNSVYANTGLGIDLDEDGVTPNDAGDPDTGSNDLLNFPEISSATEYGGTVRVRFDLDVPANPDGYRVEFFANPAGADPSGHGEGEEFASAATFSPGTDLIHDFTGSAGDVITATATAVDSAVASGYGSTSEYSAAVTVVAGTGVPPTTVTFRDGNNGYAGTVDTWISPNVADQDNSADPLLQIDNSPVQHGLIRFDDIIGPGAGQIPVGATIISADLTFEAADPSVADASLSLYRVLRSWAETDTWNTLSAGISTDDVEATSVPDTVFSGGLELTNTPITIEGLETAVQGWVDGDANRGWLFTLDRTDGWDARSSENADVAGRPGLTVTYAVGPITYVVNSTGDATDATPGDAVCDTGATNSSGDPECTLRAAIEEANALSTVDVINFAMPATEAGHAGGVWTISPGSVLPGLGDQVTIDGSTQPGWATMPIVELDGSSLSGGADGLTVSTTADGVQISGLSIISFPDEGITIAGDNTTVSDNHIGLSADGVTPAGNATEGIVVQGAATGTEIANNVLSGQSNAAAIVIGNDSTDSVVTGNLIGLSADGLTTIGNRGGLWSNTTGTIRIGGTAPGDANTFSGATVDAVTFVGTGTLTLLGNSVLGNGELAFDLDDDGVTLNDAGDGDPGPNDLLNFPELIAPLDRSVQVAVDLDVPAGDYRIEIFDNPSEGADPSGYGEGETLLGGASITHTGSGVERFAVPVDSTVRENDVLTATATEDLGGGSYGATSEYSAAVAVGDGVLTVNSTGDGADTFPGDGLCDTGGTNADADPECTVRAAIEEVNAFTPTAGIAVHFAIPTSDPGYSTTPRAHWMVAPGSPLPDVTESIEIDARTQAGWAAFAPVVYVDGSSSGATDLFHFNTGSRNSYLDGVGVINAPTTAVRASDTYIHVRDAVIGVDVDGVTPAGSLGDALVFADRYGEVHDSVISAAGGVGVRVGATARFFVVRNSRIGTGADGTGALGNTGGGVIIDGDTSHVLDGNVIAHNPINVQVNGAADWVTIRDNRLGVDLADVGSAASIPLEINTSGWVLVGGENPTDGNIIRYGTDAGITVNGTAIVPILGNTILSNGGLGIDLGDDGVTANDPGDIDTGPNTLLNHPELIAPADGDSLLTIALDVPAGDYRIDVFANPTEGADPSGFGEGESLLATPSVTHTGSGVENFDILIPAVLDGDVLTATATRDLGGGSFGWGATSEFSAAVVVAPPRDRVLDSSVRRSDVEADGGLDPAAAETAGVTGRAIPFDGFGDRLEGPALNISDTGLTMSGRVRADTLSGTSTIVSKRDSGGNPIYELIVTGSGQAAATVRVGAAPITVQGGTITPGSWHDIVATWTGSDVVLFVDGAEVDRAAATGSLATDVTTNVAIGNRSAGTAGFDGLIDHADITHVSMTADQIAIGHANTAAGSLTVSVGRQQTGAPQPWTVTADRSRSGGFALTAPTTADDGSAAWAVATGIDEPGVVFDSWWWIDSRTGVDLASGTRAGLSPTDQFDAAFVAGSDWELRRRSGAATDIDSTGTATFTTGTWVRVQQWTDQNGNSRLVVDGTEIIPWTGQTQPPATGSVAFRVGQLPGGQSWSIDDPRARRLVMPEPTATLGALDRN